MEQLTEKKEKLLLHSCCAVCSAHVISVLAPQWDLAVFYYNPNIFPQAEYELRKREQQRLLREAGYCEGVGYFDLDYDHSEFLAAAKGLEAEKEGGARCTQCFRLRLEATAAFAKAHGFTHFCTTLTVSPHKNAEILNALGEEIAQKHALNWVYSNFKKQNGYLHSTQLAKEYDLYRQDFCGCEFAWRGRKQEQQ